MWLKKGPRCRRQSCSVRCQSHSSPRLHKNICTHTNSPYHAVKSQAWVHTLFLLPLSLLLLRLLHMQPSLKADSPCGSRPYVWVGRVQPQTSPSILCRRCADPCTGRTRTHTRTRRRDRSAQRVRVQRGSGGFLSPRDLSERPSLRFISLKGKTEIIFHKRCFTSLSCDGEFTKTRCFYCFLFLWEEIKEIIWLAAYNLAVKGKKCEVNV